MALSLIQRKVQQLAQNYERINNQNEAANAALLQDIARRFRLTNRDVEILLRGMPGVRRISQRKIRLP